MASVMEAMKTREQGQVSQEKYGELARRLQAEIDKNKKSRR